jgi:hypothetical protein
MYLRLLRLDDSNAVIKDLELVLDPLINKSGDVWHIELRNLTKLGRLAFAWRAAGDEGWGQSVRFSPGNLLLDPYATNAVQVQLAGGAGGSSPVYAGVQLSPADWSGNMSLFYVDSVCLLTLVLALDYLCVGFGLSQVSAKQKKVCAQQCRRARY